MYFRNDKITLAELCDKISKTETAEQNAQIFSDLVEKYTDLKELNALILNELIDRIVIREKEIINRQKQLMDYFIYKFVELI